MVRMEESMVVGIIVGTFVGIVGASIWQTLKQILRDDSNVETHKILKNIKIAQKRYIRKFKAIDKELELIKKHLCIPSEKTDEMKVCQTSKGSSCDEDEMNIPSLNEEEIAEKEISREQPEESGDLENPKQLEEPERSEYLKQPEEPDSIVIELNSLEFSQQEVADSINKLQNKNQEIADIFKEISEEKNKLIISHEEEVGIMTTYTRLIVNEPYTDAQFIVKKDGYSLHPVYINTNTKYERDLYNPYILGVRLKDPDYDPAIEGTPSKNAIVSEIVDVGGVDTSNRGMINL
ncbi:hypothetical protein OAG24_00800 [bacterium]|nr:hypothetical protein [bacterium]